ncbi:unnamed protein product [Linum tenue]|uniref:Folate receptor-like domain-containing protein n=1 Tax=Linum tenue TaxID=586396 RepID=A0AAV0J5L0_9ROSI|nr:unnamed protein product [Linum tenue]
MKKKKDFGILALLILSLHLRISFSSGKSEGVCVSKGGRFPPYSTESQPPKKVSKGPRDLTLCRVFRKKTCCDVAQTYPALLSLRRLASVGEAKESCLQLWEALECSICDPLVGIQPGPPVICASLCDRVFQSCGDAYFSMDSKTRFLAPCGVNDFLCGRAGEWVSNGTDFCTALGFSVEVAEHSYRAANQASCYGGKRSLDHIADSWTQPEIHQRPVSSRWSEGFQLRVLEMSFSEKVSWAVGGMVLTAGLLFVSKRKSYSRRQKLAAIQRAARRLDGKMNQSDVQGKRRGNLR